MEYENKPQTQKAIAKDEIKAGTKVTTFCEYCEDVVIGKVLECKQNVYDMGKITFFNRLELVCTHCGRTIQDDVIDEINEERQDVIE